MTEDMYDYMEEMDIDEMLGEKTVEQAKAELHEKECEVSESQETTDSKSSIHPLWKLIDTWGGTLYLKARQLTLWGVEP